VLKDTTSKDELIELFKGSHTVFANTNSLDGRYNGKPGSPTEIQALHAVVDAAVDANVELLLLSCLPDLGKLTQSYHDFANKVDGANYARQIAKATGLKVVYIQLGWYITNFIHDHDPTVNEKDGFVEFFMRGLKQDKRVPWVSTYTDLGPIVKALIDNPEPYIGREIPIVAELLTMDEIASVYQNVTGQPSRAISPPAPEVPVSPQAGVEEWAALMHILNEEVYLVAEDMTQLAQELMRKERPQGMTGWERWLKETRFDAKKGKEGYSEEIGRRMARWGGRKFV